MIFQVHIWIEWINQSCFSQWRLQRFNFVTAPIWSYIMLGILSVKKKKNPQPALMRSRVFPLIWSWSQLTKNEWYFFWSKKNWYLIAKNLQFKRAPYKSICLQPIEACRGTTCLITIIKKIILNSNYNYSFFRNYSK